MSLNTKSQSGFSVVELLIVAVVVGLIGFAGYTVYDRQQAKTANSSSQVAEQSPIATDVPAAPEVASTDDLNSAQKLLDESDVSNTGDSSQLDAELAAF